MKNFVNRFGQEFDFIDNAYFYNIKTGEVELLNVKDTLTDPNYSEPYKDPAGAQLQWVFSRSVFMALQKPEDQKNVNKTDSVSNNTEEDENKPPSDVLVGVRPRLIIAEKRLNEINEAIKALLDRGHLNRTPSKWIKERNELVKYLKDYQG